MQELIKDLNLKQCPVCEKSGLDINPEAASCPQCESDLRVYPLLDMVDKELQNNSLPNAVEPKPLSGHTHVSFFKLCLLAALTLVLLSGMGSTLVYLLLSRENSSHLMAQKLQTDLRHQLVVLQQNLSLVEDNSKLQYEKLLSQVAENKELVLALRHNEATLDKNLILHSFQVKDTLWEIAKHYWGDGRLYPLILELNPHLGFHRTIPGSILRIEMRDSVIKDLARLVIFTKGKRRYMNYLVQEGDTFQNLALRFYGSTVRVSLLTDANEQTNLMPDERIVVPLPY